MTIEEIIDFCEMKAQLEPENENIFNYIIRALEQKPYEKFESAKEHIYKLAGDYKCWDNRLTEDEAVELCHILEQKPCEMTVEEYRQRIIQAFHNANTDELIAICVLPTEKEFEHLEWLLKNHYKKEPCEDCISREQALKELKESAENHANDSREEVLLRRDRDIIRALPSVTPQEPGWIPLSERLPKEDVDVLVCTKDGRIEKAYHTIKEWTENEWEWFVFGTRGYSYTLSDSEVVAWQPLPQPYTESE